MKKKAVKALKKYAKLNGFGDNRPAIQELKRRYKRLPDATKRTLMEHIEEMPNPVEVEKVNK